MLTAAAIFLALMVGTAIQPIVAHAAYHARRRAWARRHPFGTCWCEECGKAWFGKAEAARQAADIRKTAEGAPR